MKIFIVLVISSCLFVVNCAFVDKNDAYQKMIKALEDYKTTGKRPSYLETAARKFNTPNLLQNPSLAYKNEFCTTCGLIVDLMFYQRKYGGISDIDFTKEVEFFCNLFSGNNERVCKGYASLNAPVFMYIIDHKQNITGAEACGISYQYQGCELPETFDWSIEIPPGNTVQKPQSTGRNSFNILHITDIHYDPRYAEGKTNNCGEPVCCQNDQPDGITSEDTCGYWSDYINADIPWRTVMEALDETKKQQYDYVYFTGDIIAHRTWNTSVLDNTQIIAQIMDALDQTYKVPVYVALGNHEAHPPNLYSEIQNDDLFSTKWLYNILLQKLSKWIPIDEAKETILKGGYYTVSPRKGFRIVVLNNNVCNTDNWWLVYNSRDPYDQLKWLTGVLLKAEQNNERVHLLHHVPSGRNECFRIWSREFRKIIDRFANTIAAQFNGHTHRDEFYIYYNRSNPDQAVNTAWNGASIVTYDKANPSYKLLSIDEQTLDLLDFEEWTFNLTLANLNRDKKPQWYKLYSFKDAYGVNSLDATEISKLVYKMTKNHQLIDQYYRFKFRNSDAALKEGCDDDCKKDLLCTMVKTEFADDVVCDKVKKLYDQFTNVELNLL
ncbi:unnamed protein product [Phyllotreta striolata]|uniref:Sphingomyelin phosphodiesterase n=1 Tax=Phyllotreta striolata TaxID=444603 RepID=A0A9N9TA08_PHYSR|nr:unnamed protein product [Phyllotreta striolata]